MKIISVKMILFTFISFKLTSKAGNNIVSANKSNVIWSPREKSDFDGVFCGTNHSRKRIFTTFYSRGKHIFAANSSEV